MILATDPVCQEHDPGRGHPEQQARYGAVRRALEASGLWKEARVIGPKPLEMAELQLAHDPGYLALAEREIRSGQDHLSTGDTNVSARSWAAALAAAGCAVAATEAVVKGEAKTAFCLVRPPGHHATAKVGMGFCVLNSIAIAARYARERLGIARVLIVDWDVHHGNGTQDIFYADPSVFFFSTHQSPWYPGTGGANETGTGAGIGTTLNCPLPAGSGRSDIFDCFEHKLLPAMERFRPELVLVSAGFDSRENDPLGRFRLRDEDFADLTKMMRAIAETSGKGRVVSVLEGGYNLEGLAKAASAHAAALL
jgi:acetoin utilization deacetylase AcuC-like enzyme